MNRYLFIILLSLATLIAVPSYGETVYKDDLVERNFLYYKKFTDSPFTGKVFDKVSGSISGLMIFGKYHGDWVYYHKNGQLRSKQRWNNGTRNGIWEWYHNNGQLSGKGAYKDGEPDGLWESFNEKGLQNGTHHWIDGVYQDD